MNQPPIVALVRCEDYNQDTVTKAAERAVELAELQGSFTGKSVLLKPNLLSARRPEEAVTTHPSVVRALAQIALACGGTVSIGDSPPFAGENKVGLARLLEATGIARVASELGIETIRLEDDLSQIEFPSGRYYKSFDVAEAVLRADCLVNIPKLKTHGLTVISGAVKNLFGCVPGLRKGLFHARAAEDSATFSQMLVDLALAIGCRTHLMDAVTAMEGNGPNSGRPRHVGVLIASSDPVALDAVSAAVVGINPMSVDTIRLGQQCGLGVGRLDSIEIRGESVEDVAVGGFKLSSGSGQWTSIPGFIRQPLRKQLVAHPVARKNECTGCGDCIKVCPVKAIAAGRPVSVDYSRCIRCYCCHEVCDTGAMTLRRGLLGRAVLRLAKKK